jgi:hypothetical protein
MFKREPNSTEVLEYLLGRSNDTLPYTVISAAFRAGEEVRAKILVGISARVVTQNGILRNWFVRPLNASPMTPIWRPSSRETPE